MLSNFAERTLTLPWIFQHCELFCISCGSSCEMHLFILCTGDSQSIPRAPITPWMWMGHLWRRNLGESSELPPWPWT